MKINVLRQTQNPHSPTIMYAPELKLSEGINVSGECFPAVFYSELADPMKYFFILASELGEYEEYTNYRQKGIMYSYFGGKEGLESKFQEMYEKQKGVI